MKQIKVSLDDDTLKDLLRLAGTKSLSVSSLVRMMIKDYLFDSAKSE